MVYALPLSCSLGDTLSVLFISVVLDRGGRARPNERLAEINGNLSICFSRLKITFIICNNLSSFPAPSTSHNNLVFASVIWSLSNTNGKLHLLKLNVLLTQQHLLAAFEHRACSAKRGNDAVVQMRVFETMPGLLEEGCNNVPLVGMFSWQVQREWILLEWELVLHWRVA